jgi:pantetheine-phosphate adenylyltransferase
MIAMYPGTFDPVTLGHEDIIARAANVFETLWVAVALDSSKAQPLLSFDERFLMAEKVTAHIPNVKVCKLAGLLVDCAAEYNASVIVRSARNSSDFDVEFQLAVMNEQLGNALETWLLLPRLTYSGICARLVREICMLGGDISSFVSPEVAKHLNERKR